MLFMSIIGAIGLGVSPSIASPSPVCPYNSHSNATIVWRDLTHLTEAPPDIPKHIHSSKVFCDIFIHPFICSTVRREATPWETTACWGHVTRRSGRQVALNPFLELWIALMTVRDETEEEEGWGSTIQLTYSIYRGTGHVSLDSLHPFLSSLYNIKNDIMT